MSGFDSQTQVEHGDIRGPLVDGDGDAHSVSAGDIDPVD